MRFANRPEDQFIVVGTVKELVLRPRSHVGGSLLVYRVPLSGDNLELVHRTPVEDMPAAIVPFQGKILVGVGKYLRIYELGKKKLLRKCENKVLLLISVFIVIAF